MPAEVCPTELPAIVRSSPPPTQCLPHGHHFAKRNTCAFFCTTTRTGTWLCKYYPTYVCVLTRAPRSVPDREGVVDQAESSRKVRHSYRGGRSRRGGDHGAYVSRVCGRSGSRVRGLWFLLPFVFRLVSPVCSCVLVVVCVFSITPRSFGRSRAYLLPFVSVRVKTNFSNLYRINSSLCGVTRRLIRHTSAPPASEKNTNTRSINVYTKYIIRVCMAPL